MSGFHTHRIGAAVLAAASALFSITAPASASVEISTNPTANMSCSGGVCTPTAKKAVLNVNDLATMLASDDTAIKSTSQNSDIEMDAALSWTSNKRLSLDAYHSIALNNPVEVSGNGSLTITANDGGKDGDFRFFKKGHIEFWDLSSNLMINGHSYKLIKTIKQLGREISHNNAGYYALAKNVNAKGRVYGTSPIKNTFEGVFEGLGNAISNLSIVSDGAAEVGLFSELGSTGPSTIRDIGLLKATVLGEGDVGTLVGYSSGNIVNCYATGSLSAINASTAGGLVGVDDTAAILKSYADVTISAAGASNAGGLVGRIEGFNHNEFGVVEQSFALGAVSSGDSGTVGGLVGSNLGGAVLNSYAVGNATGGSNSFVGGLIGSNTDNPEEQSSPAISTSYSTGVVSGGSAAELGGLAGHDVAQTQNINDYWDLDTSGITDPAQGAGNIQNDPGVAGLSDAQLKSGLPSGFDGSIWKEKTKIDNGYPYLLGDPPPKD